MATTRQHIIQMVGHKLGVYNYNAYAMENGLPLTKEQQEKVDWHMERFGTTLKCEHVSQLYSTLFTNSVQSFLMGYIEQTHESHGYKEYTEGLTDRSYLMLLNAIVKRGKEVTDIYIDAELSKIRMAKRNS